MGAGHLLELLLHGCLLFLGLSEILDLKECPLWLQGHVFHPCLCFPPEHWRASLLGVRVKFTEVSAVLPPRLLPPEGESVSRGEGALGLRAQAVGRPSAPDSLHTAAEQRGSLHSPADASSEFAPAPVAGALCGLGSAVTCHAASLRYKPSGS